MTPATHLLLIDPQNDFCDLPARDPAPSLPVTGADADMRRVAALIRAGGDAITDITVTLDTHQRLDIAHPGFWQQADGSAVAPFTPITAAKVRAGRFAPREAGALPRTLSYLDALEARGRYTLMVWPVHCEIGSWGHNIHAEVLAACDAWEDRTLRPVLKVTKGENRWTEHYSAIEAEVPDADDPRTQRNTALIERLRSADRLLVAGEAGSHCVKATVEHLAEAVTPDEIRRIVLLTDCISPVAGFEAQQRDFLAGMQRRGAQLMRSDEALAQLRQQQQQQQRR